MKLREPMCSADQLNKLADEAVVARSARPPRQTPAPGLFYRWSAVGKDGVNLDTIAGGKQTLQLSVKGPKGMTASADAPYSSRDNFPGAHSLQDVTFAPTATGPTSDVFAFPTESTLLAPPAQSSMPEPRGMPRKPARGTRWWRRRGPFVTAVSAVPLPTRGGPRPRRSRRPRA